jgi:hypothetical protein
LFYIILAGKRPFRITFKTDQNEVIPTGGAATTINDEATGFPQGIIGFSLDYRQVRC